MNAVQQGMETETTFLVQRAGERVCFDHGWLQTCHSFSFADYYDPKNVNWGALRVLNDDVVAPGEGFPTHPHRDMEIITYVLEGRLEHRDSTGSQGVVGPGGAQFMSAGTGVRHSEYNHSKGEPLHFLQMWLTPGKLGTSPSYGQVEFTDAQRLNTWLPIASGRSAVNAPVKLTQNAAFFVTRLEVDRELRHTFDPQRFSFLFVAEGSAQVEGALDKLVVGAEPVRTGDAIRMSNVERLTVKGPALLVLWDLPAIG
ncbi:MAG: pirin family protein [Candidatus Cybelea sp.]